MDPNSLSACSPRIYAELRSRKIPCGRNRVAPNLLAREFRAEGANQRWAGDITYVWTREGWLYLAVILDLYSRKVVGWAIGERVNRELTLRALAMALGTRSPRPRLLHHSDRGGQYACGDYRKKLKDRVIQCSMSRKGDCYNVSGNTGSSRGSDPPAIPDVRILKAEPRQRVAVNACDHRPAAAPTHST